MAKIASFFKGGGHVLAAGCNMQGDAHDVVNNIATNTMSGTWDEAQKMVLLGGSVPSPIQWYTTRECAKIFLWTHANTSMNMNGVDFSAWEAKPLSAADTPLYLVVDVSAGADALCWPVR